MTEAGWDISALTYHAKDVNELTRAYREKFTRLLEPEFRIPLWTRAENGPIISLDEALDGIPECFRRTQRIKKAPLKIGINISRTSSSGALTAIRGGAVLALIDLCKSRGQNTEIEVCYGNTNSGYSEAHLRIELRDANVELLTRINCSPYTLTEGLKSVGKLRGTTTGNMYRLCEVEGFGIKEYDFYLDRIDTTDRATEEARVMNQLRKLKLM